MSGNCNANCIFHLLTISTYVREIKADVLESQASEREKKRKKGKNTPRRNIDEDSREGKKENEMKNNSISWNCIQKLVSIIEANKWKTCRSAAYLSSTGEKKNNNIIMTGVVIVIAASIAMNDNPK